MKNWPDRQKRFSLMLAFACACAPFSAFAETALDRELATELAPTPRAGMVWQSSSALAPAVSSTEFKAAEPLTLAELTDLALRNNPATREAWAAARAQAAALGITEAEYFPTIDASATFTRGKSSVNSSTGVTSGNTQTRLSPSISLSYVLFDFGARSANQQAASYALLAANLNQNRALQDVVLRVEQAYYQLLAARQTIVAAEETLKTAQVSFEAASARRQAGLATIGDVYQADTALAQSRLQLRRAQGEAGKFKGTLCNAIGLPVNAALELAVLDAPVPTQAMRRTVEEYLAQAKAKRPDLGAAEAQSRAAHASTAAAAAQGRPSLDLSLSAGKTYNNFLSNGISSNSSNGTLGATLQVPLFDGFRTTNTVKQAQARAEQLDAARDRIALQVELEVWQAYSDLDTLEAAISSARTLLRSASQSREVAQERYQAGVGNLPDLLTAQAAEANARMEVIRAEMGWYASLSLLNNAIGKISSVPESK